MPNEYTDRENVVLSKIAYYDMKDAYASLKHKYPGGKVPISALVPDKVEELKRLGATKEQLDAWTVVDIHDTNDKNGFAACIVETSPDHAAVAFRGSENWQDRGNIANDWANADLALLDKVQTEQQAEVDRFLGDADVQRKLSQYNSIGMTGHSLGGNLAEYAAITADRHGDLDSRLNQCVSLDGPGFNKEFLHKHRDRIDAVKSRMTHYRWSLVGNMLKSAAQKEIDAAVKEDSRKNYVGRHFLENVAVGSDGSISRREGYDPYGGGIFNVVTWALDRLPQPIKEKMRSTVSNGLVMLVDTWLDICDTVDAIKNFFGWNKKQDAASTGSGAAGSRGGSGGKDRILVSTEALRDTVNRYRQAQERMNQAIGRMNAAWDRLNTVWDGAIKVSFMAEWVTLMGNVRKSESAIRRSIDGLTRSAGLFEETEADNTGRAQSLNPGVVPPLF